MYMVNGKETEWSFASIRWKMADYLLRPPFLDKADDLWMLAYRLDSGTVDPVFELVGRKRVRHIGCA